VYITERLTVNNVTGTSVDGGSATVFETSLLPADGTYNGMTIEFISGPCKGIQATILAYVQLNGQITLTAAMDRIPDADDFIIWTGEGINGVVNFDLPITSRFCKIVYIGISQLTGGPMAVNFEIWESTAARLAALVRTNIYQRVISRNIVETGAQGADYGESLAGDPMPYYDRDAIEVDQGGGLRLQLEETYRLHCRIENDPTDGTLSDFTVTIKIADMGENA
jgi:hypothetical protein